MPEKPRFKDSSGDREVPEELYVRGSGGTDDGHEELGDEVEVSREEALSYREELIEFLTVDQLNEFIDGAASIRPNTWIDGVLEAIASIRSVSKVLGHAGLINTDEYQSILEAENTMYEMLLVKRDIEKGKIREDSPAAISLPSRERIVGVLHQLVQRVYEESSEK